MFDLNSIPIADAMKNSIGLWDQKILTVAQMAIETSQFFFDINEIYGHDKIELGYRF